MYVGLLGPAYGRTLSGPCRFLQSQSSTLEKQYRKRPET